MKFPTLLPRLADKTGAFGALISTLGCAMCFPALASIGAALGLVLPTVLFWPAQMPGVTAWLALLVVGVLCTGVAYVLYFRLIDKMGASASLTVTFLIPVFAVIYGVLFLGEAVTAWMLICGAVILFGTALSLDVFKLRNLAPPAREGH